MEIDGHISSGQKVSVHQWRWRPKKCSRISHRIRLSLAPRLDSLTRKTTPSSRDMLFMIFSLLGLLVCTLKTHCTKKCVFSPTCGTLTKWYSAKYFSYCVSLLYIGQLELNLNELAKPCLDSDHCGNPSKDPGLNGKTLDLFTVKSTKGWWACFKPDAENPAEPTVSVIHAQRFFLLGLSAKEPLNSRRWWVKIKFLAKITLEMYTSILKSFFLVRSIPNFHFTRVASHSWKINLGIWYFFKLFNSKSNCCAIS